MAAAARELRRVRAEALPNMKGGLRALYRTLDLPGANPLKDAHAALDTDVLTAYGFNAKKFCSPNRLPPTRKPPRSLSRANPWRSSACQRAGVLQRAEKRSCQRR